MTSDLITRLEQAEAGSRELDLEIWGNHVAVPRSPRPWELNVTPPAYTTSLDAVTALIGEKLPGYYFGLQENRWPQEPERTTQRWTAYLNTPRGGKDDETEATHRDKHIACCIALLRAIKEGAHG